MPPTHPVFGLLEGRGAQTQSPAIRQQTHQETDGPDHAAWFSTVGIFQGTWQHDKNIDVPLIKRRLLPLFSHRFALRRFYPEA